MEIFAAAMPLKSPTTKKDPTTEQLFIKSEKQLSADNSTNGKKMSNNRLSPTPSPRQSRQRRQTKSDHPFAVPNEPLLGNSSRSNR